MTLFKSPHIFWIQKFLKHPPTFSGGENNSQFLSWIHYVQSGGFWTSLILGLKWLSLSRTWLKLFRKIQMWNQSAAGQRTHLKSLGIKIVWLKLPLPPAAMEKPKEITSGKRWLYGLAKTVNFNSDFSKFMDHHKTIFASFSSRLLYAGHYMEGSWESIRLYFRVSCVLCQECVRADKWHGLIDEARDIWTWKGAFLT